MIYGMTFSLPGEFTEQYSVDTRTDLENLIDKLLVAISRLRLCPPRDIVITAKVNQQLKQVAGVAERRESSVQKLIADETGRSWNWRQKIAWTRPLGNRYTHQFPKTRMVSPTEEGQDAGPHKTKQLRIFMWFWGTR